MLSFILLRRFKMHFFIETYLFNYSHILGYFKDFHPKWKDRHFCMTVLISTYSSIINANQCRCVPRLAGECVVADPGGSRSRGVRAEGPGGQDHAAGDAARPGSGHEQVTLPWESFTGTQVVTRNKMRSVKHKTWLELLDILNRR